LVCALSHEVLEASPGLGSLPLGWRAEERDQREFGQFGIGRCPSGLSGTGGLDPLLGYLRLPVVLRVVGITLTVDLVLDHLRFSTVDHGPKPKDCCHEANVCGQGVGSADQPFVNASLTIMAGR